MPIIQKPSEETAASKPRFDLRDIELILKHLMNSDFKGVEVAQAHITMNKLRQVHANLVSQGVVVNAS